MVIYSILCLIICTIFLMWVGIKITQMQEEIEDIRIMIDRRLDTSKQMLETNAMVTQLFYETRKKNTENVILASTQEELDLIKKEKGKC